MYIHLEHAPVLLFITSHSLLYIFQMELGSEASENLTDTGYNKGTTATNWEVCINANLQNTHTHRRDKQEHPS